MKPKFRAWDKRFSEFVEDFFVSEDGKISINFNNRVHWNKFFDYSNIIIL